MGVKMITMIIWYHANTRDSSATRPDTIPQLHVQSEENLGKN